MKKRVWIPVAIALFAIVDLALVYLAVQHTSSPPSAAEQSVPTAVTDADVPPVSSVTSDPTSAADTASGDISLISIGSDGTVLSATSAPCTASSPAELAVSDDGGQSYTELAIPEHQVLRVIASSGANLQYVGAGQDCQPALYQSVDGGKSWSKGPVEGSWSLSPGSPTATVQSPEGQVAIDCVAVSISVLSKTSAFVVCDDGSAWGTTDGGANWDPAGEPQGIVSVSFLNENVGYALAVAENCPAEIRRTTNAGETWGPVGCIPAGEPMAIDAIGQQIVATVGGEGHVSYDGGVTWT